MTAWRARAAALPTDLVLLGFVVAAVAVPASFTTAIPTGLGEAPEVVRAAFRAELSTPAALVTATLAALYAGFDYTLDLKNGVVARETTAQRRVVVLGARAMMSVLGGAIVGFVCISGIVGAAAVTGAGWMLEPLPFVQTAAVGALASLWGFAVAILVRHHLVALFVVPATLGIAVPLAAVVPQVVVWLPLPALVGTVGVDEGAIVAAAAPVAPGVIAAAWLLLVVGAAVARFLTRDVT